MSQRRHPRVRSRCASGTGSPLGSSRLRRPATWGHRSQGGPVRYRPLLVEPLEIRTLLANVVAHWIGGSGNWSNPANWDIAAVPNNSASTKYDVVLDVAAANLTITMDINATVDSLTNAETLRVLYKTGTVTQQFANSGVVQVESASSVTQQARLNLPSGVLTNEGRIELLGGNVATTLTLAGSATLSGTGEVVFDASLDTLVSAPDGSVLTIGAGQTIRGGRGNIQVGIANSGVIVADTSGTTLAFNKAVTSNQEIRTTTGFV